MTFMKDSARSATELPEDLYLGSLEKSAHEQRRSQISAGDYTQPFWPHQYEKSRYEKPRFLGKPHRGPARQGPRKGACQCLHVKKPVQREAQDRAQK